MERAPPDRGAEAHAPVLAGVPCGADGVLDTRRAGRRRGGGSAAGGDRGGLSVSAHGARWLAAEPLPPPVRGVSARRTESHLRECRRPRRRGRVLELHTR